MDRHEQPFPALSLAVLKRRRLFPVGNRDNYTTYSTHTHTS